MMKVVHDRGLWLGAGDAVPGGFYMDSTYVKYTTPMATSLSLLAASVVEFTPAYQKVRGSAIGSCPTLLQVARHQTQPRSRQLRCCQNTHHLQPIAHSAHCNGCPLISRIVCAVLCGLPYAGWAA